MNNKNIKTYIDNEGIYHLIIDDKEELSIKVEENGQVVISTQKEVWAGPPHLLNLSNT